MNYGIKELDEFSQELGSTSKVVFDNVDPVAFSKLVKSDHQSTELLNSMDKTTDLTLGVSIAGIGILLVMGVELTGAVSFIISNPIGWVIGSALGFSLLWKLFSDPKARKKNFIKDKRDDLKEALNKLLNDPAKKHNELSIELRKQFYDVASAHFSPLVRDARLAIMQYNLEVKTIKRIHKDTREACRNIISNFTDHVKK